MNWFDNKLQNIPAPLPSKKLRSPPRVIFTNWFFYPDLSAGSQILSDLCFHLVKMGNQVVVVTSRLSYDDPSVRLPGSEVVHGVVVHRVATSHFGRATLTGRAMDYLTFYLSAGWTLWRLARRGDVVVAMTDPPLISIVSAVAVWLRGARLINWLQDIFPEVAGNLGFHVARNMVGGMIANIRDISLRKACSNVVLGERMMHFVAQRQVPESKIKIIHNWADDISIVPIAKADNPLVGEWGFQDRFVVAYSGNLGRAHEFDTILGAAELLRHQSKIVFLVIGGGAKIARLKDEMANRKLSNIIFKPYQNREALRCSLGVADLHLVSLQAQMEGLIVPSKFYGIAAAGRPVIFIGDPEGEIAQIVRRYRCGEQFREGDSKGVADCILGLSLSPEIVDQMGRNARRSIKAEFSQIRAFGEWECLLAKTRESTEESSNG